jgi:hypothetical protein
MKTVSNLGVNKAVKRCWTCSSPLHVARNCLRKPSATSSNKQTARSQACKVQPVDCVVLIDNTTINEVREVTLHSKENQEIVILGNAQLVDVNDCEFDSFSSNSEVPIGELPSCLSK